MSDEWKQFIADDIAREENLPNYWDEHPDNPSQIPVPSPQPPQEDQEEK